MSAAPGAIAERVVVVAGRRLATAVNTIGRDAMHRAALIVLPAAGFVWADYRAVLEHFASERRVAALDWPGFGGSDRPSPATFTYSAPSYSELLDPWLNAVGATRAVLLGNGIGGATALRFAMAHPERVAGLALVAPWGFHDNGLGNALQARLLGMPWLLRLLDPFMTSLALGPATPATRQVSAAHRAAAASDPSAADTTALSVLWRARGLPDTPEFAAALRTVAVPTIVIRGALDPLVSAAEVRRVALAIGPRGALEVVLPASAHLPFLQQPGPFLRAVSGLFETVESGEASQS